MKMLDSVIKAKKKYYPQPILEECRCEIKKKKIKSLIDDDDFDACSSNESDKKPDSEPNHEYGDESDNESKSHFKNSDTD